MSVKDDPDVWPYLPALQDAAARARAMQSEVNQLGAGPPSNPPSSRVASDPSRVAARRSRADTPGAFSGYQDHWDDEPPAAHEPERYVYNETMRSLIEDAVKLGLAIDGAHHKQWALQRIAHLLDIETDTDPGIAP